MKDFCPGCLNVLPQGYAFDHVAIDRALAGDTTVLAAMDLLELQELVFEARRRGLSDWVLAERVHRGRAAIRSWAEGQPARRPGRTPGGHLREEQAA
jgi:hypothetical protein